MGKASNVRIVHIAGYWVHGVAAKSFFIMSVTFRWRDTCSGILAVERPDLTVEYAGRRIEIKRP